MDYSTEQEIKRIWRVLRCKANCGSTGSVIEITKTGFLNLVSDSSLQFPATYKITDVDNGLWVETLSNNTFSLDATISLFVPDYVASGSNLGQMDANTIPSVGVGEKVIWGDHYWSNTTGAPVTPVIVDFQEITGLTKEIKASGSSYEIVSYSCLVDTDLNILTITSNTKSVWFINTVFADAGFAGAYIYFPLNNSNILGNNLIISANNKGELNVLCPYMDAPVVVNNTAKMHDIIIEGGSNEVSNNTSTGIGSYSAIKLFNTNRLKNNSVSGASYNLPQIGFIELFDNCEVNDNTVIGDGAIWDIRAGEESHVNNNIVDTGTTIDGNTSGTIQDIDQIFMDNVNNNELYGYGSNISMIHQFGFSELNNNILNGDYCAIKSIRQSQSSINNFTLTTAHKQIAKITLSNSVIENGNDVAITDCVFNNIDIDFTGFSTDVSNEIIEGGKGWFTITHDFGVTPVNAGSSVLYNIIPNGARVTNIKTFGTATGGAGAELAFGIDTDAPSLIASAVLATVNAGQTYNSVSTSATANRSLNITAAVENVTGGNVTVLVEFVL